MFTRLNRALNALSQTIQKARDTIAAQVSRLGRAAQRDVSEGAQLASKQVELESSILIAGEEFSQLEVASEEAFFEELDVVDQLHEGETVPEWIEDAQEEYPDEDIFFGDEPLGMCDGGYHTAGPFVDIAVVVNYLSQVPTVKGVTSPDGGISFFVWICDNS